MSETEFSGLNLSPRLLKIARLLPKSKSLADIGTDHAYIPVWALKNHITDFAVASDINKGPLERARENVLKSDLSEKVSLRIGPGLSTVTPGEAETIIIAGMGGILISDILAAAKDVVSEAKCLILQPMTAIKELREYISQNSFTLTGEYLVREDEKIYTIIALVPGGKTTYTEKELILGKGLTSTSPELFDAYKAQIVKKYQTKLRGLLKSSLDENLRTAEEVKRILDLIS